MSLAIWFFILRYNIIKRVHTCTQHTFLYGFKLVRGLDAFFFFLFSFSNQLMWSAKYVLAFSFSVLLLVLHHLSNRLLSKALNSILTESFPYPHTHTHRSSAANCLSSWRKIFTKPLPLPLSSWNMACVSIINRYSNSHPIVKMYPLQE